MNKAIGIFFFALAFLSLSSIAQAERLTVYTAAEPELLNLYAKEFKKIEPEIELVWIRDAAGPLVARIIAEKDNPSGDLIFGVSLRSVLSLKELGLLAPFSSELPEDILFIEKAQTQQYYTPINAWTSAICINTKELEAKHLTLPQSWQDLTKPEYKNEIVMAHPASSSTALMTVNAWIQSKGEEAAWDFMEELDANISMYVHAGCKPCQMAARGETSIGIASENCAKVLLDRKAPLQILYFPNEGLGWDIEVASKLQHSKNNELAQKLIDFASSEAVADLALSYGYLPVRGNALSTEKKERIAALLNTDIAKEVEQKEATIARWRSTFEPK